MLGSFAVLVKGTHLEEDTKLRALQRKAVQRLNAWKNASTRSNVEASSIPLVNGRMVLFVNFIVHPLITALEIQENTPILIRVIEKHANLYLTIA